MPASQADPLVRALRQAALPLAGEADLDPLLRAIGDARYALLGEASHGTHEFYAWRCAVTRRLVLEKQCAFIAVEGDWPDCYRLNRYVKGYPDSGTSARQALAQFARWPAWMWANNETAALAEWLRVHNMALPESQRVGFYGLDVYSLWESMAAVVGYLESVDPALAEEARRAYLCFEPYGGDPQAYARAAALAPASCEDEAVAVLRALREKAPRYARDGPESYHNAEQNALVAQGAEKYYRAMLRGGPASWNVRDHHMADTLDRLMARHPPHCRCVVWEHNTHVGDAHYTDMARSGMVNVGQLVRMRHARGAGVHLTGFGTYSGTVMAGRRWGAPMRAMRVPPARSGSLEWLLHRTGGAHAGAGQPPDMMLVFDGSRDGGINGLDEAVDHRAIGVVYDPETEHWGNYVPTLVPRRYDSFLFIDETRAVDALHTPPLPDPDAPETYPSGM